MHWRFTISQQIQIPVSNTCTQQIFTRSLVGKLLGTVNQKGVEVRECDWIGAAIPPIAYKLLHNPVKTVERKTILLGT